MAKTKITLALKPTFTANVMIPMHGSKAEAVPFTFKGRTREQFVEWMGELKDKTNVQAIMECASGWGLDEPFDAENVELLDSLYMGAAAAILDKYIGELTQAKLGN